MLEIVKKYRIVAVDGRCGSGKSTFGAWLQKQTGGNLIHMDDFYLQPYQRTPERYRQPGENVDHERFLEEVLKPLEAGIPFSYHPFDPSIMAMSDKTYHVDPSRITIIEGSYSLHRDLRDHYDLRIFLDIEPQKQLERLRKRNPEKIRDFEEKWIPLEELYFNAHHIREVADIVADTGTWDHLSGTN